MYQKKILTAFVIANRPINIHLNNNVIIISFMEQNEALSFAKQASEKKN